VGVVAEGRKDLLSPAEVRLLADGSIYFADEAHEKKLVDEIGYIDDAIALTESLAGLKETHVVEYKKPFSLSTWLTGQNRSLFRIDKKRLQELAVPQLLYLWWF
jgi:protease-4